MHLHKKILFFFLIIIFQSLQFNLEDLTSEEHFQAKAIQQLYFCFKVESFSKQIHLLGQEKCTGEVSCLELEFASMLFLDLDKDLKLKCASDDEIRKFIRDSKKEFLTDLIFNKMMNSKTCLNKNFKSFKLPFFLEDYFLEQWQQDSFCCGQRLKKLHLISRIMYRYYFLAHFVEMQFRMRMETENFFSFLHNHCWQEVIHLAFYIQLLNHSHSNLEGEFDKDCYQKIINIAKIFICNENNEKHLIEQMYFYEIIFDDEFSILKNLHEKQILKIKNKRVLKLPPLDLRKLDVELSQEDLTNSGNSLCIPSGDSISSRRFSWTSTVPPSSARSSVSKLSSFPTPTIPQIYSLEDFRQQDELNNQEQEKDCPVYFPSIE